MPAVRPFQKRDSSQVAHLHHRVFKTATVLSPQLETRYEIYFNTIFLNNPWADPTIPSLVFEEPGGEILGFLGVIPQPMFLGEQPIMAAVGSQLIVDPARRSTMAGVELLKTFLSGPQDFSFADEANEYPRKIWKAMGGYASIPQSIHWVKVFRPGEFLLSQLAKPGHIAERQGISWTARLARPFCRLGDAIAAAIPGSPFGAPPAPSEMDEPTVDALASCMTELTLKRPLRPAYDGRSLRWRLEIMERHTDRGSLRKGIVQNSRGEITGWYLYYAKGHGLGEVLQLCANESSQEDVLDHLFFDAWKHRVAALCGRLEPNFMDALRKKQCLLYNRGYWMLVHSRNPTILQTIRCGDAFLSRLEGECGAHFGKEAFRVDEGELEVGCGGEVACAPLANTTIGDPAVRESPAKVSF